MILIIAKLWIIVETELLWKEEFEAMELIYQ
jgi:hypothetical protein